MSEDESKWVYLMAQKCEKIKLKKDFLKSHQIFAPIINNIEKSIENENAEIVIFLPDCNLNDLHNLIKYLTIEDPVKLEKVCLYGFLWKMIGNLCNYTHR